MGANDLLLQPLGYLGGCVYECRLLGSVVTRHDHPVSCQERNVREALRPSGFRP
jgi:hypothetical protein